MRIKFLIFLGILCCVFVNAEACSCIESTNYYNAEKVFTGKILKIDTLLLKQTAGGRSYDYQLNRYSVSVIETFKGKKTEKTVFIYSGGELGDCGYKFTQGKTYIIFATKKYGFSYDNLPSSSPLVYFTSDCSDTAPYNKQQAALLRS